MRSATSDSGHQRSIELVADESGLHPTAVEMMQNGER
jgi:hypothetical protein